MHAGFAFVASTEEAEAVVQRIDEALADLREWNAVPTVGLFNALSISLVKVAQKAPRLALPRARSIVDAVHQQGAELDALGLARYARIVGLAHDAPAAHAAVAQAVAAARDMGALSARRELPLWTGPQHQAARSHGDDALTEDQGSSVRATLLRAFGDAFRACRPPLLHPTTGDGMREHRWRTRTLFSLLMSSDMAPDHRVMHHLIVALLTMTPLPSAEPCKRMSKALKQLILYDPSKTGEPWPPRAGKHMLAALPPRMRPATGHPDDAAAVLRQLVQQEAERVAQEQKEGWYDSEKSLEAALVVAEAALRRRGTVAAVRCAHVRRRVVRCSRQP